MSSEFKPGDRVIFKLTSQQMIVKAIAKEPSSNGITIIEDRYVCMWFDGVKDQFAIFHKDLLESFPPYYDSMHYANYE